MFQNQKEKFESIEKEVRKNTTKVKNIGEPNAVVPVDMEDEVFFEEVVVWRKTATKFQKQVMVESFNIEEIQKRFESNINVLNKDARINYEYQITAPSSNMAEQFEEITDLIYENKNILWSSLKKNYRIRVFQEKTGNIAFSIFMNLLPREIKARDFLLRELFKTKCRIETTDYDCKILHNHRLIERSTIFGIQINQKN